MGEHNGGISGTDEAQSFLYFQNISQPVLMNRMSECSLMFGGILAKIYEYNIYGLT